LALVLDTGVLYAYLDRHDPPHEACVRLLRETTESLVVPAPVVTELDWLISSRSLDDSAFLGFLSQVLSGAFEVLDLTMSDISRVASMLEEYADTRIGFVDASVLVVAERLNEPKVATIDRRHFSFVRPRHTQYLTLLP
jgi:predicted nucleic acid-binding protein